MASESTYRLINSLNADVLFLRIEIGHRDKRIAELELLTTWQPIESAPKDGTIVTLYGSSGIMQECKWRKEKWCIGLNENILWCTISSSIIVTHWMHVIPPPTDQQGE